MIHIGVSDARNTTQSWTWLLGALPRVVNRTIMRLMVHISATKQEYRRDVPVYARLFRKRCTIICTFCVLKRTDHVCTRCTPKPPPRLVGAFLCVPAHGFRPPRKTNGYENGYEPTVYKSTSNHVSSKPLRRNDLQSALGRNRTCGTRFRN